VRVLRPGGHSGAATSCGTAPVVVPNAGRAFPREGAAQTRPLKATSGHNHAECTNHACRGARMRTGPSFGAVRDKIRCTGGNSSAATPSARVTPVVGVRMRAAPLSGGSVTDPTYWGQLRYNPLRCGSHACRGAWICTAALSGATVGSGALEFAPEQPRCESQRLRLSWPGCVLQPLRGRQDGSEARTHLRCCHAPCEISRRNVRQRTSSPSGNEIAS